MMNTADHYQHDTEEQHQASEPDFYGKWQRIETAPKDGTKVMLATPAGITIGSWSEECPLSDCGRAIQYAGWQGDAFGETRPGTNMIPNDDGTDGAEAEQQCAPEFWMKLPEMPEGVFE